MSVKRKPFLALEGFGQGLKIVFKYMVLNILCFFIAKSWPSLSNLILQTTVAFEARIRTFMLILKN